MRLIAVIGSCLLGIAQAFASPCDVMLANGTASPFVCHGHITAAQFSANGLSVTNPTPNTGQLLGECPTLPYVVPTGSQLIVDSIMIEGGYGSGAFIFVGAGAPTNASQLDSVQTGPNGSAAVQPSLMTAHLNYWIAGGSSVGFFFNTSQAGGLQWSFSGCTVP